MYYYGGYNGGYGNSCGYNASPSYGGYAYPSYGYGYGSGLGYGYGSGAAIVLVLFILLVIIIGTRSFAV